MTAVLCDCWKLTPETENVILLVRKGIEASSWSSADRGGGMSRLKVCIPDLPKPQLLTKRHDLTVELELCGSNSDRSKTLFLVAPMSCVYSRVHWAPPIASKAFISCLLDHVSSNWRRKINSSVLDED